MNFIYNDVLLDGEREVCFPEFVIPVSDYYTQKITEELEEAMKKNMIGKLTVSRHDCDKPFIEFKNGEEIKCHKHPKRTFWGNHIPYKTYLQPERIIFNEPATIVFWEDGTKTIVKAMENDEYDPEVGFAMAYCKKIFGSDYRRIFKDVRKQYEESICNQQIKS